LTIVLSVLRYADSDYPFDIFLFRNISHLFPIFVAGLGREIGPVLPRYLL
jgi:hypothetical protein